MKVIYYGDEMNQYPTIFITFAGTQGTKEDVVRNIKNQILNVRYCFSRFR